MLKSDIRHQLWLTRKTFQRKLGAKEDDCVVASDSELDAKIELFKFIQIEGNTLHKIIDQYQERICILAQEENTLGKFLKENGKFSQTTDKVMINCGRAISYCGQMRFLMRPPLLRFFNEIEVFRLRAITDTQNTITSMEKQRTEYRASLSWMKSVSNMLDPDSDRMLEKFRAAQTRVRRSKDKFDKFSLDCLQKIDLLAASRCNMFSHTLIAYMESLAQFFAKSVDTLKILSSTLTLDSHYNFNILKSISHVNKTFQELESFMESPNNALKCSENNVESTKIKSGIDENNQNKIFNLIDVSDKNAKNEECENKDFSQFDINIFNSSENAELISNSSLSNTEFCFEIQDSQDPSVNGKECINRNDEQSMLNKPFSWFDLFCELDPLANPDDMTRHFGGTIANTQAA